MNKQQMVEHLATLLRTRIDEAKVAIASTYAARNADGKSSAGDKHEVGRAMIQQELDKEEARLQKLHQQLNEVLRVPLDRRSEQVGNGSLVITDQGSFLIAIGLGPIEMEKEKFFAISVASPIGSLFKGKVEGDAVEMNGKKITIIAVH